VLPEANADRHHLFLYSNPQRERRWYYYRYGTEELPGIIAQLRARVAKPRKYRCCLIAASRPPRRVASDLLSARLRFAQALADQLHVYGRGWDRCPFPELRLNWRGIPPYKQAILRNYEFALCFENSDSAGYITEKLVDALMGGTVPLYYGGGSFLANTVPADCFVDCRLRTPAEVADLVQTMDRDRLAAFREAAIRFFESDAAKAFTYQRYIAQIENRFAAQR